MAETGKPALSEAEQKFCNQLAKAIWDIDVKEKTFDNLDARKAAYKEECGAYIRRAKQIVFLLKKREALLPGA